jgi:hypothetical protein
LRGREVDRPISSSPMTLGCWLYIWMDDAAHKCDDNVEAAQLRRASPVLWPKLEVAHSVETPVEQPMSPKSDRLWQRSIFGNISD